MPLIQPRLLIEVFAQDEEARVYYVNWELSQCLSIGFEFPAPVIEGDFRLVRKGNESFDPLDLVGPIASTVLVNASKAQGVEGLIISRYWLKIFKSPAFDWTEVGENIILEALMNSESARLLIERNCLEMNFLNGKDVQSLNDIQSPDEVQSPDKVKFSEEDFKIFSTFVIERFVNDDGIMYPIIEDGDDDGGSRV